MKGDGRRDSNWDTPVRFFAGWSKLTEQGNVGLIRALRL